MKIIKGIVPISKCAEETLSRGNKLRESKLDIQDINCGCPDCVKRAEGIELENGKIVGVGQLFEV